MTFLLKIITKTPLIALFITISLGYLVGKIRFRTFVLGGIAGTLLVGVVVGQIGIKLDDGIKPKTHSLPCPARLTGCQTRGFAPVT